MSVRVPALQGVKGLPIVQVQKVHIYLPVLQDMNRKAPMVLETPVAQVSDLPFNQRLS